MALPGSGAISLAMIRAEFGGPIPISLQNYYRGGAYVPNTPANSNIPTSGPITIPNNFWGATAYTPPTVSINNQSVTGHRSIEPNPFPPPGTIRGSGEAIYQLLNSGQARKGETQANDPQTTVFTNFAGEWLTSGTVGQVDVECVVSGPQAGIVTGPTGSGVWSNLATTRTWSLQSTVTGHNATLTIRLRDSTLGTILDTATITLTVAL